ncbi:hypothetical protein PGTUg99_011655 [Puccinia graminis f. sp. tritici]|uniref:Uncharacterized protein n=1 Tax=Puccinia graminis f. sp. tritici TaxID=56615 RepID=A0A5B0RMA1_PUCGR|nr:hypothetical protein PGTUg99_011655 [Puccinia graminis f. sp. tritici]
MDDIVYREGPTDAVQRPPDSDEQQSARLTICRSLSFPTMRCLCTFSRKIAVGIALSLPLRVLFGITPGYRCRGSV